MEQDPIQAISNEIESAAAADNIGMFTIKTANRTVAYAYTTEIPREASLRL